jgi:hypothetical protein
MIGPGFRQSHGAGRHTTTGAGSVGTSGGAGGRGLSTVVTAQLGRLLMFPFWDSGGTGESGLDSVQLVGFLWGRAIHSSPGLDSVSDLVSMTVTTFSGSVGEGIGIEMISTVAFRMGSNH